MNYQFIENIVYSVVNSRIEELDITNYFSRIYIKNNSDKIKKTKTKREIDLSNVPVVNFAKQANHKS